MKIMSFIFATLFTPMTAWAADLSDPQIVEFLHVANVSEITSSQLAEKQAISQAAKDYAGRMVKEHKALDDEASALAKKLQFTLEASDLSMSLKAEMDKDLDALKSKTGAEFESTYIDTQVKEHQKVLTDIDQVLLPTAENPELKALLESARQRIQSHLDHAQKLQKDRTVTP